MRDKATNPLDIDYDDLEPLTEPELTFGLAVLAGKSLNDAYVEAHPNAAGWSRNARQVQACREHAKPKMRLWMRAWRLQAMERGVVTLEQHTGDLGKLKQMATLTGNYGAAVKAEELRGRANGLYVDRIETKDTTRQAVDILAKLDPALRALLGPQLGLDLGNSDADTSPEKETKH